MKRLRRLLERQGWSAKEMILVGDRGTLSDKLALAYDDHKLRYLAGLRLLKNVHRALLLAVTEEQLYGCPLTPERGASRLLGSAMLGTL